MSHPEVHDVPDSDQEVAATGQTDTMEDEDNEARSESVLGSETDCFDRSTIASMINQVNDCLYNVLEMCADPFWRASFEASDGWLRLAIPEDVDIPGFPTLTEFLSFQDVLVVQLEILRDRFRILMEMDRLGAPLELLIRQLEECLELNKQIVDAMVPVMERSSRLNDLLGALEEGDMGWDEYVEALRNFGAN
ncbi:25dd1cb1-5143-48d0-bcee-a32b43fd1914 [Thermothielavioides terrestris]|uniref:25dd1cb1-5143-48d0-bcee-a32b43fd1914 n=1 Tax=Thermothielavioides terrestris TaxID=2587410 RepID=A0A446BPP2_9PEZI|nr:25dd1cb1-5143-48d0-bcee-a32b43fd1914 [Thermothielavioides terrestris]